MEEQIPGEKNVRKEELCNRKIESGASEGVMGHPHGHLTQNVCHDKWESNIRQMSFSRSISRKTSRKSKG